MKFQGGLYEEECGYMWQISLLFLFLRHLKFRAVFVFFKKVGYLALHCLIWRHIRLATLHPSSPLSFLKGLKSSIY